MRQAALLGTPGTKRTVYLERAALEAGIAFRIFDWKDWGVWRKGFEDSEFFLKIDPPVWESCSLNELNRLTEEYLKCLEELIKQAPNMEFLNEPGVIGALLDKRACKDRLLAEGLSVTETLSGQSPLSAEELLDGMRGQRMNQVFIKPLRGSGAAGVSAFRWQPDQNRMALYTCALQTAELGLINTKRLRRFSDAKEIIPLLNHILALGCIVERWYAKGEYRGCSYDLRVVMQDGEPDFILARLSKGPVTNLHLNNHPLEVKELGLPAAVLDSVVELCRKSMECYPGLRSAGLDVLLEKGSMKPRIIEMNAQGDLIYQDIYHENKIYQHQAQMIKTWLSQGS